jgi:CIC family chloride channel protein
MTNDYKIILPLMIASIISTLVVRRISKDSIYSLKLSRKGIDIHTIHKKDLMEKVRVGDAMFRRVITVNESTQVKDAGMLIKKTTHRGFPVLDNEGRLKGIITHQDINKAMSKGMGDSTVMEFMSRNILWCYPDETLKDALEKMGERNIGRLPVVDPKDHSLLIGLVTRKGIITAYNEVLRKE